MPSTEEMPIAGFTVRFISLIRTLKIAFVRKNRGYRLEGIFFFMDCRMALAGWATLTV